MKTNKSHRIIIAALGGLLPAALSAQDAAAPVTTSYFSNPLFNTLLLIIGILAIVIIALASVLKDFSASNLFQSKLKEEREKEGSSNIGKGALIAAFILPAVDVFSQEATKAVPAVDTIGGLDQPTFYGMLTVIGIELVVLGILFSVFKTMIGTVAVKKKSATKPAGRNIFDKLNDTVEVAAEETIMLDHDYDGIKELDNNLPPWWKYGFYLTILIGIVYLVNYHISKTSPLQKEEYTRSVKKAELEIAEYMKNSANNVDESTVKMLPEADVANGKTLFIGNCSACHGKLGEGGVGPNLTDDYWLHGGSIQDIFKTVKYGWPDKGMKSWKEDFSPVQIAQISSFVRTLHGTNPPNPKDKQGDLYTDPVAAPADSAAVAKPDSVVTTATK